MSHNVRRSYPCSILSVPYEILLRENPKLVMSSTDWHNYSFVNDNTILYLHFFYVITNYWNYQCCLSRMRERNGLWLTIGWNCVYLFISLV